MHTHFTKALLRTILTAFMLFAASLADAATTTVNLTAQRMTATLPDGAAVPMWGYCKVGTCTSSWTPGPTITVSNGDTLIVNLTNNLPIPTSLVILGQLGGGLGVPTKMDSPVHASQTQTTWPANADALFTPPAQGQRVSSFATEVAGGTTIPLTWNNLKPGTYIYETGTLPSIQAPMGLYGVLVVNAAPDTSGSTPIAQAYPGIKYDSAATLLFSEIDPVQNTAADNAAMAGTDLKRRFDDPACAPNCYPAAVNFTPTYFLINGLAFDKTVPEKSALAVPGNYSSGNILVRLLNAGLRTHVPAFVGLPMTLVAEDGNLLPGTPKMQNEVLLTAGKTHDVLVNPPQVTPVPATGAVYGAVAFPVFDRHLSLSSANQSDGGMQGFLQVAAGALPNAVMPLTVNDDYQVPLGASINGSVKLNDIAVGAVATVTQPGHGTLIFNANGNFVYTPNPGYMGTDSFSYNGNGGTTNTATVTLSVGSTGIGIAPTANADTYTSSVATTFMAPRPGVLANDSDPSGYPLTAVLSNKGSCASVQMNADGSFTATSGGGSSCQFTYVAKNSQLTQSGIATVDVTFIKAGMKTGLNVVVVDPASGVAITDYRWTIQEDLTFKVVPTGTPSLSTRTLATSFHISHMPIIATGCVGVISCGSGQSVRGLSLSDADALLLQTSVGDVVLDPTKHYYISVLPGDAGDSGHAMGGAEIKPSQIANSESVTINSNALPYVPAQLSVYIYEDNAPTNNQNDLNETGLGGFNIILLDAVGRSGDPAGQQTYDAFNMPLSNALLGRPGCPDTGNAITNGTATSANGNMVGVVYTCPNDPNAGTAQADAAKYALAGHALIKNLTPARYDVIAHPGAEREGAGEVWWQVETLEGTPAQDGFTGVKEPVYFQEFGPPGFHTTIGFVNPDHIKKYATVNGLVGTHTITGRITNQHMSRPSNVTLWDAGSYDLLSSTTCQVVLNSQGGDGPAIAAATCDRDGNFTLSGVPAGAYEVAIFDQWLDQIIQFQAVTVGTTDVALGNIPVLSWFTQYNQNIYQDLNKNGIYDAGEPGISNLTMTTRYRDGGISNQTATDSNGNGLLAELFPLFNWYVTEADTTRFKQTGVNVIVDAGGPTDSSGDGLGLWNSVYQATAANPTGCDPTGGTLPVLGAPCAAANTSNRVEIPGSYSYGLQGFISQRNTINWGRAPYVAGENGGIQGVLVYSTTRPFDDQRYNVQTLWEPLVPHATVNLYHKEKLADGTETLTLVDTTRTSSFDDFVNAVDANGKQTNMQCPGQRKDDPFFQYTLNGTDQFRCYDGWHNWNQVQAAPYDGRYNFPSAAYIAAHPLTSAQISAGQTLVSLPPGQYVVEAVTPTGYDIVKEEDKNILNGDTFVAPVTQQFGGLGNIFILPDQATLNNANANNPMNADGIQNNATSNLGVTASLISFPECVGNLHRVPDYLSLFPQGGLVAPFAGMDRPLCDRKLINLNDQTQASATFFVFTQAPTAAAGAGIILDDATSEFNVAAPDFGEKASVPFVPVSIKDFNGREISRAYSDQWGAYNVLTPSSWLVNPPTPSGYGPNMLVTCMNDPGPIRDPITGKMITDPQYNPAYSNFCYTNPFMPGRTTYLDTPVLPVAAFAAGYNPTDCAYPDVTPAISRVDSSVGFGPYLPSAGGTLTIAALGDQQVQNPGYAGPFATSGPSSQRTITRHYDFRGGMGSLKIGNLDLTSHVTSWSDSSITLDVPSGTPSGELVITNANGNSSVDTVTVTIENRTPARVQGGTGGTIQSAIDAATPGDLILVDAGTYNELVIMWKPVRLQGVGATSVIINAAKYPTNKLEVWRTSVDSLFSIDMTTGNQVGTAQIDPLPTQEITGGVVLLEPSVLGSEQGPGITVLAKNLPASQCSGGAMSSFGHSVTESNFLCAPSRIDGISVTGGDAGGGIYVNGWAHNLEIANNRVYGNAGDLGGGVRVGVPNLELEALPTSGNGNNIVGFGYDNNVNIHHNAITKNGTVEAAAGIGGAGSGVSICTGTDGYSVDHNWICGNFSASNGGGVGHLGFSQGGSISHNQILFNQSFQQTTSTHGGGIFVSGEPAVTGTLSLGAGTLSIDANLIRGNFAESGHGGGIRLQQVNGADVALNPNNKSRWFSVSITNNMIENNVAGWGGGGISMADTLASVVDNNTISSNDSVGIAGTVLAGGVALPSETPGVAGTGKPSPAGISSDPTSAQLIAVLTSNSSRTANRASNPDLKNNIVWKNRSFFYKVVAGNATLCSSNSVADAGSSTCNQLVSQATTGQCTNTNAGAPAYWDIGVLGDFNATPGPTQPLALNIASGSQSILVTVNLTNNLPAGFNAPGQTYTVTINAGAFTGTGAANYTGSHLVTVVDNNTFTYVPSGNGNVPMPSLGSSSNRTLTLPGGAGTRTISSSGGSAPSQRITVTITTATPNSLTSGQSATITGFSGSGSGNYNGAHTVTATSPTVFTYSPSGSGTVPIPTLVAGTVTPPAIPWPNLILQPSYSILTSTAGYAGAGSNNSSADPRLVDMYCNGSRVAPEFPNVVNPPSVKNLQVAATIDEGNNYVSLRYGPLYLSKPSDSTGTAYTSFGDYHIGTSSPAKDAGTTVAAVNHDFDGDFRPQGTAYDIGADELALVRITPTSLAFGNRQINTTSAALNVTVQNLQNAILSFGSAALSGANASSFAIPGGGNTCGTSITANGSCTISVTFTPNALGSRSATLTIVDGGGTQSVALSGTGTAAPATVSPNALTFSNQLIGTTSGAQTVTLTNPTGNPTMTGLSFSFGGNFHRATGGGSAAGSCSTFGGNLNAGSNCTVNVVFAPSGSAGTQTGTLLIGTSSTVPVPAVITLTGTATIPVPASANPTGLTFNNQLVGTTSGSLSVTLSNPTGNPTMTGVAFSFAGNFHRATGSAAGSCSTTGGNLNAGSNCTVNVVFAPTGSAGTQTGTLTFVTSSTVPVPAAITLTGTATVPGPATVTPGTVGFPNTNRGSQSGIQTVLTVSNPTTNPTLTGMSYVLGGSNPGYWTRVTGAGSDCGTTLNANSTCNARYRFTPPSTASGATAGAKSATVTVSTSMAGVTFTPISGVTLTGSAN